MNNRYHKIKQNNGFTLLEVMIAMVIFAVGMLGLAGIQALSLESSHSSYSRTQAILLASEMIDRMKANNEASNYVMETETTSEDAPAQLCDDSTVTCNATQMANFDQWQWKTTLSDTLLTGRGTIVFDSTTEKYTVTVYWDEERSGATGMGCSTSDNDLRCIKLTVNLAA